MPSCIFRGDRISSDQFKRFNNTSNTTLQVFLNLLPKERCSETSIFCGRRNKMTTRCHWGFLLTEMREKKVASNTDLSASQPEGERGFCSSERLKPTGPAAINKLQLLIRLLMCQLIYASVTQCKMQSRHNGHSGLEMLWKQNFSSGSNPSWYLLVLCKNTMLCAVAQILDINHFKFALHTYIQLMIFLSLSPFK